MTSLKGKVLVGLASTAMLGGIVLGGTQASADEVNSRDTDVTVGFSDNTIIDPDPNALELRAYPSAADFGNRNDLVATDGNIIQSFEKEIEYGAGAALGIYDGRSDEQGNTWELTGKASELKTTAGESIGSGAITFKHSLGVKNWLDGEYDSLPGIREADNASDVTSTNATELTLGDESSTVVAGTSASIHRQGYAIPVESAKLTVPNIRSTVAGKQFSGKVTWTLNDTLSE